MKKFFLFFTLFMAAVAVSASEKIAISDIAGGKFAARYVSGIRPIPGTSLYARISSDGKQIVEYSFKTGKQTRVLFDVANTMGSKVSSFDGYVMSPDGLRMLIQTKTEPIYRRSFKAQYYIYTIASRKLEPLSVNGPQQVPTWSPDGMQISFVRNNNIFLVKLLYDNAESQVTKDGEFNKVINGVPDWVNEEEFGLSSALTFTADGTMICWVKYDETDVKTYSLQMFQGQKPALMEYADYPRLYSYKYPKAGQDNSKVSVWSYDIKSHKAMKLQVPLDADGYIPRIKATSDASRLLVLTLNRHQDELNIYSVNPRTTVASLVVKEKSDKYVKEEVLSGLKIGKNTILMPSDRSGYMNLYLYNMNGQLLRTRRPFVATITDGYGNELFRVRLVDLYLFSHVI